MSQSATFGKYELVASLGHGGMADVFLAVVRGPSGFNKLLVVKSMRNAVAEDERFRSMMLDEARLAARLHHPNVVQTLEVGDFAGRPFIAMEYLDGQALNGVLASARSEGRALEVPLVAHIICEALSGLHYSHELADYDGAPLRIVHRDVSPHNLFVTYEGEVKVVDFGIAKAATNAAQTELGGVKGKVAYMAPEQARGETVDRRADVFAMGLVLWEMLASRRMLQGDSTMELIEKLLRQPLPALRSVRPDVSPALEAVVDRALDRDPSRRFQTAQEMRLALLPFATGASRDALGQRLKAMFQDERARVNRQIQQVMQATPRDDDAPTITTLSPELLPEIRGTTSPTGSTAGTANAPGKPESPRRSRALWLAVAAPSAFVFACAALLFFWRARGGDASPAAAAAPPAPPPEVVAPLLRLHGSNTIGSELAPALAEAFLRRHTGGKVTVRRRAAPDEISVEAREGDHVVASIEVHAHGSATAFEDLAADRCDVGMSSRRIKDEESAKLAALGKMTSAANEHVVALDGLVVIVNPANPVSALTEQQIADMFSGAVRSWSDIGGNKTPVHLYARDDRAGTYDTFKQLVLGQRALDPGTKRIESSEELSDAVAADEGAIGFIGLPYVRSAKAVMVHDTASVPLLPSPLTVSTEDYPLSRRLYLYTSSRGPVVSRDFVDFTLSDEGQRVVQAAGMVDLRPVCDVGAAQCVHCARKLKEAVRNACRVSIDFRFDGDTSQLDTRGLRDLQRLPAFLGRPENANRSLLVLGFADGEGPADSLALSQRLASTVAEQLRARSLNVSAVSFFGQEMPVADGATPGGKQRNRRVELWLR